MRVGVRTIRRDRGLVGLLMLLESRVWSLRSRSSSGLGFPGQIVRYGLLPDQVGMIFVSRSRSHSHWIHVGPQVEGILDLECTLRIECLLVERIHREGVGVGVVLVGIGGYGSYGSICPISLIPSCLHT